MGSYIRCHSVAQPLLASRWHKPATLVPALTTRIVRAQSPPPHHLVSSRVLAGSKAKWRLTSTTGSPAKASSDLKRSSRRQDLERTTAARALVRHKPLSALVSSPRLSASVAPSQPARPLSDHMESGAPAAALKGNTALM